MARTFADFQYQKGAIKTDLVGQHEQALPKVIFNTKKVRLKRKADKVDVGDARHFQYQKGAIKTAFVEMTTAGVRLFSIPKRCD